MGGSLGALGGSWRGFLGAGEESWGRNPGGGTLGEESWRRNPGGGILGEESWRRNLGGGILESRKHLGGLWEASRRLGCLGSFWGLGGSFCIVKMGSKCRERPFRRRVAKVGVTKYRILHGSSAGAQPEPRRCSHSPAVTHAARNPTAPRCFGNLLRFDLEPKMNP